MANFVPLKNYMLYCLDEFIARYDLVPPFLDVGCGIGDVSRYMAAKGWDGKAIDFSDDAVTQARRNLTPFPQVVVETRDVLAERGRFNTILLWDVVEHVEDDVLALARVAMLLNPSGHVLISVPSNPGEWRWDDDFYGHYRRYTVEGMTAKLAAAGLTPLAFWDFTYPVFWAMRRAYTRLKPRPVEMGDDPVARTKASSTHNAWDVPMASRLLDGRLFGWQWVYRIQFAYFRKSLDRGHEMFVLAGHAGETTANRGN